MLSGIEGEACSLIAVFHVLQLRDSTQPDAEIFSHNAGTALPGVSGCHLYGAHQAAALHWCPDVCMPAEQQGAYTGVATGATMAYGMPRCKLNALNLTVALAKCTLFLDLRHAGLLPLTFLDGVLTGDVLSSHRDPEQFPSNGPACSALRHAAGAAAAGYPPVSHTNT